MSEEPIGFGIGISATLVYVTVIWLFNALTERANKRRAKKEQSPQRHASKTTAAIKSKRGNAFATTFRVQTRATAPKRPASRGKLGCWADKGSGCRILCRAHLGGAI